MAGIVQSNSTAGHSVAFSSNVTSGNLLIVAFKTEGNITACTVSDTLGTSYTLAEMISGQSNNMAVYYGTAPSSGANTVTIGSAPNNFDQIAIMEANGASASVDASTSAYNGSSPNTLSITTTQNDLIVGVIGGFHNSNTFSFGGGFSFDSQSNGSDAIAIGNIYGASSTYTLSVTFTSGGADNSPIILVAFPSTLPPPSLHVSKANAYTVLSKPAGLNVSKSTAYAVLERPAGINVSKANVYAVLMPVVSNPPVWPSFAFVTGVVGSVYTQSWDLAPAASPTTYTLASGTLPPGLSLNNVGADVGSLSGTPTTDGVYTFELLAVNAYGSQSKSFTVTIITASSINPVPVGSFPPATIGTAYSTAEGVSGGQSPFTFAITAGSLPVGLTLDTSDGIISGTPSAVGTSVFTITITDANGNTGSQAFSIEVVPPTGGLNYGFVH